MFTDVNVDLINNGVISGEIGEMFGDLRFDPGFLRPFVDSKGRKCVTLNTGKTEHRKGADNVVINNSDGMPKDFPTYKTVEVRDLMHQGVNLPIFNATTLRKDEWKMLDLIIVKAARNRLRAWADLAAANTFGGFNGMSKTILEHETMSDPGEAIVDMDGITEGRSDAPRFQLEGLPLPITHSSFSFSSRQLATSRNTGMPLDSAMGEASARRVAETIEQTTIGGITGATYGVAADYGRTPTVYGYTNFPDRTTKIDLTASATATGETILSEVLEMVELSYGTSFYGPFRLYVSTAYDALLDDDFKANSDKTTRQRLNEIESITGVRRLDYLTGDVMLLVQMTSDVARAVNGMDITTIQWESKGGMQLNFKVMAIQVPQLRADFNGNAGIIHGTTA